MIALPRTGIVPWAIYMVCCCVGLNSVATGHYVVTGVAAVIGITIWRRAE